MYATKFYCRGFNFTQNIAIIETTVKEMSGISIKEIDKDFIVLEHPERIPEIELRICVDKIVNAIEIERRQNGLRNNKMQ